MSDRTCPLGNDCDLTGAWLAGYAEGRRAITPAEAARVLRELWFEGAFENDADAAVQDLLDFGITDGHDIIENWLKAIAGDDTAPEDAT